MEHNTTYLEYITNHKRVLAERHVDGDCWWMVPTTELLMQMPGVEEAARPILYPLASYGDTDIKIRLVPLGNNEERKLLSVRESLARKLLSRCSSYAEDFPLQCLIYDIAMARELTSIVNMANAAKASPDDYASRNQGFSQFWETEQHKF